MTRRPTIDEFLDHLRAIGRKAVDELGQRSARIQAEGFKSGAAKGSKAKFPHMRALDEAWDALIAVAVETARIYERRGVPRAELLAPLAGGLADALGPLREASKVESPPFPGTPDYSKLADIQWRLEDLEPRMRRVVGQYEAGVDSADAFTPPPGLSERLRAEAEKQIVGLLIGFVFGLVAGLAGAYLGFKV